MDLSCTSLSAAEPCQGNYSLSANGYYASEKPNATLTEEEKMSSIAARSSFHIGEVGDPKLPT